MNELPRPDAERRETAGQEFVRRIRPAGCVLFLALMALMLAICFTSGRAPIDGYEPPESTEYYAQNPAALAAELEEHVFPALPDYDMSAAAAGDVVVVTVYSDNLAVARAAVLHYFDASLLEFVQG